MQLQRRVGTVKSLFQMYVTLHVKMQPPYIAPGSNCPRGMAAMERSEAVYLLTSAFQTLKDCCRGSAGPFVIKNPKGSVYGKQRLPVIEDVTANLEIVMALTNVSRKWATPNVAQEAIEAVGHTSDPIFGRTICRLLSKVKDHVRRNLETRCPEFGALMAAVRDMEVDAEEEAEAAWYDEDQTNDSVMTSEQAMPEQAPCVAGMSAAEASHWLERAKLLDLHMADDTAIIIEDEDEDKSAANSDKDDAFNLEASLPEIIEQNMQEEQEETGARKEIAAPATNTAEEKIAAEAIAPTKEAPATQISRGLKRKLDEEEEPPVVSTKQFQDIRARKLEDDEEEDTCIHVA